MLLDTHTFIWYVLDVQKLTDRVQILIDDSDNEILLGIASVWEAIKHSNGKLSFGQPFRIFIDQQLRLNNIDFLNINLDHIDIVATLPLHHRDPFDRLLIAQAMVEQLPILSADSAFDAYSIGRLW
mgnify:CR=1 FL=1